MASPVTNEHPADKVAEYLNDMQQGLVLMVSVLNKHGMAHLSPPVLDALKALAALDTDALAAWRLDGTL